ncbi:MAG: hydantoinase/oxoprolinase family protein [Clostridiaceae bacterium]|nr:hydantoinase/oxoprolinase family protein [Clostridiaceae bacterium]
MGLNAMDGRTRLEHYPDAKKKNLLIGIDMGGTNIDGVVIDDGVLIKSVKRKVDRSDFFRSIWGCLQALLQGVERERIGRINLSTTISTNAIVEKQLSGVGLILQTGPGLKWEFDELEDFITYLSGSVDHRGSVVQGLDQEELAEIRARYAEQPPEALAVVTKFSTRNPEPELQIRDFFAGEFEDITLGHSLSGKLNFPRRVQTAYLNAAVGRTFRSFVSDLQQALERERIAASVYILKADGGTVDLAGASARPVESILSGPAASFMGMMALQKSDVRRVEPEARLDSGPGLELKSEPEPEPEPNAAQPSAYLAGTAAAAQSAEPEGKGDMVLIDIGGTTTDLFFLVDGVPVFEPQGIEIDGRKTLVRAIFSTSIGLGGDSHVRSEGGILQIGPRRLDNAVAYGGKYLTPTDALVYLGALSGDYPELSKAALEELAVYCENMSENESKAVASNGQTTRSECNPGHENSEEAQGDTLAEVVRRNGQAAERLAREIIDLMCRTIAEKIRATLTRLNASPVYTIKELLTDRKIRPQAVMLIGGPAQALAPFLAQVLGLPVTVPQSAEIANAIGAALARPTQEINLLADTERGRLSIPELAIYEPVGKNYNLAQAKRRALTEVKGTGQSLGLAEEQIEAEVVEASSFNMISGWYQVDRNIRVKAQIKPGLLTELYPGPGCGAD